MKVRLAFLLVFAAGLLSQNTLEGAMWVDLEVESIRIQPDRPDSKDTITAVASIRNVGSEESGFFNVSAKVYKSGKMIRSYESVPVLSKLPRLGSGLSVPVELGVLREGAYKVVMTADSGNVIPERNEKNNEKQLDFRVVKPGYRKVTYGYS